MARIVWLDMETTGLDPHTRVPLALGMKITDEHFNSKGVTFEEYVHVDNRSAVMCDIDDDVDVWSMHQKSGLWDRCEDSVHDWRTVRTLARAWLRRHLKGLEPREVYLAGNSIHFDRGFLAVHAPELLEFFHYRMLDASTFKVLAEVWGLPKPPKAEVAHTPLADIEGGITELRYLLSGFSVPTGVL